MSDAVECPICGDTFGNENALRQHTRDVHPETVSEGIPWEKIQDIVTGLGIALVLLAGGYGFYVYVWPWMNAPELPGQGDHWHARYSIEICGETLSPLPYSEGDIHTHGKGRIHIHPHSPRTAGKRANLQTFMESLGGMLSDTRLVVPNRGTYAEGQQCPDGTPGEVVVYVNGERVSNPDRYVPQNGDRIRITFRKRSDES